MGGSRYVEKAILVFDYEFNVVKRFELDLPITVVSHSIRIPICVGYSMRTDEITVFQ